MVLVIKRNKWVHVKASEAERAAWQEMANNAELTLSDLVRSKMGESDQVGRSPKRRKRLTKKADPELLHQLAKIGNNINQLAKWANQYKSSAEAVAIISHLSAIDLELNKVLEFSFPTAQPVAGEIDDEDNFDAN
jgi:hypothetical protein